MGSKDTLDIRYRIIFSDAADYNQAQYMQGAVYWKTRDSAVYAAGTNPIIYRFPDSNFVTMKHPMQGWNDGDTLLALRLDFLGDSSVLGINSTNVISPTGPQTFYHKLQGTSMAAPHVTGIAALMIQKYDRNYLLPAGKPIHQGAFWNSSVRSILAHTAKDLIHIAGPRELENPDLYVHDLTHGSGVNALPGPDYATGYGMVNAPRAIAYVDTNLFKQDSVDNSQEVIYNFDLQNNVKEVRVSLAWDDLPGNPNSPLESPKLINDLDITLEDSSGHVFYPWVLDPLPQLPPFDPTSGRTNVPPDGLDPIDSADVKPAYKSVNSRDNLEVVDASSPSFLTKGRWKIRIKGTRVAMGTQHFSLVSDYPLERDTLVNYPDSLHFEFQVGGPITTSTAYRPDDSTVYFGSDSELHAFDVGQGVDRWTYTPHSGGPISNPVISGGRIFIRAQDSLYCIQDNGESAALVWARRLQPDDDSASIAGDTSTLYFVSGTVFAPAVDPQGNRLYVSSEYSFSRAIRIAGPPPWDSTATFWDSTISFGQVHKMWTFNLDGTLMDTALALEQLSAAPSAGAGGGFFVDFTGRLYKVSTNGNYLGSAHHMPAGVNNVRRQPALGPNRKVYVQSDSMIVAMDQVTGDSLATFASQRRILSNMVVDQNENLFLVAYVDDVSPRTALIQYSPSGLPEVIYTLADGLHNVGELSLGSDGLLYFILDNKMLVMNTLTEPPFEGSFQLGVLAESGHSPNIANRLMIVASGDYLYGYGVTTLALAAGWSRSGKDNTNGGFEGQSYPGFIPLGVGSTSSISSAGWNTNNTKYTLCSRGAGMGGNNDDFGFAYSYLAGNFEYTARIDSLSATAPSAKAGIMVLSDPDATEGLAGDAVNAFIWLSASNMSGFSRRLTAGSDAIHSASLGSFSQGSTWVKVRRIGSRIFGFVSFNNLHFTKIGEMNIGTGSLYVGPAHTSASTTTTGCAEFSEIARIDPLPAALFVVGSTSLTSADSVARAKLINLGYEVTTKDGVAVSQIDANGKDLIVISSTVTSASVGTKFRTVPIPVLTWEQAIQDELAMTGSVTNTDQGTTASQTQVKIVNASHSMAAGLSGNTTIYSSSGTLSWGKPGKHAIKIATLTSDTTKAVLYAYEQGTAMLGLRAPARRVGLFLADNEALQLNSNGSALFDSAVRWVTGPISPSAVFVVGNTSLSSADQAIKDNLEFWGYSVASKSGTAASTGDANGKNLIVISATVNSVDVGSKFTNAAVPIINAEETLFDDLGMTGSVTGTHRGPATSQSQVKILTGNHPLAARLTGTVTVCSADSFSWGKPNAKAYQVGSLAADTSKKALFAYEQGDSMVVGIAPARRVGIFFHNGAQSLTASGYALFDASIAWATGFRYPTALLVVGNTTLTASDSLINARLQNLGYSVTVKSGSGSSTGDAAGKSIVVISSTITSGDVNTEFKNVDVGVLNWEQALLDDFGMTGNVMGTDRGNETSQTQLSISAGSHPLAIGYSGTQTVFGAAGTVSWGKPNGNATKVATVVGDANKALIFSYEKGASMVGATAPARRVGFLLEDNSALLMNTTALNLFDAAVRWASEMVLTETASLTGNYNWLHRDNWDGTQNAYNGQAKVGAYFRGPSVAYDDEVLVKFDLSGISQVSDAKLKFHVSGGNSNGNQTTVLYKQTLSTSWNSQTVYYDQFCNTLADCPSWTTSLGSATVNSSSPGWVEISSSDLTTLVQGWLSTPSTNQGVVLTGNFAYWGYYIDVDSFQLILQ
jgi:hypothetical protein